jgi:hypothetical protein
MENGIGRLPLLQTFWQRLGAWVDRRGSKEGLAAQIFFTSSAILGAVLCFGFRPVLAGFRDWLQWRLAPRRTMDGSETIRALPRAASGSSVGRSWAFGTPP